MEDIATLSAEKIRRKNQIQQELLKILDNEESFWQQRSRQK
jgi:hypothetical protein